MTVTELDKFMDVVSTMPPEVRKALLVLMQWKANKRA
jgi:hypothetical protein